jgi:hypothetical protein
MMSSLAAIFVNAGRSRRQVFSGDCLQAIVVDVAMMARRAAY